MIMTLFRPAIWLLLPSLRRREWVLSDDKVPQDVFRKVEVALERADLIRLKTEVGDGVKAFDEASDGIGEAATSPLINIRNCPAPLLDKGADALDGHRETFIARVRANDQY
jgi:hypothetical protein